MPAVRPISSKCGVSLGLPKCSLPETFGCTDILQNTAAKSFNWIKTWKDSRMIRNILEEEVENIGDGRKGSDFFSQVPE